jgi:hypothetical protein
MDICFTLTPCVIFIRRVNISWTWIYQRLPSV